LWLDNKHENHPNIRCSIPGYKHCEKLGPSEDGQILVHPNNSGILLEDQVDLFLFTSCEGILRFLNSDDQRKFIKYPSSIFRIVSNRRLFLGENGLLQLISENPIWQFVFPEILIFHGDDFTGLQALSGCPNISSTNKPELCKAFVTFGAVIGTAPGCEGQVP
jgi:hypothetical protein